MIDFTLLEYETATDEIPQPNAESTLFASGDHWQDGDGWVGPQLDDAHPAATNATTFTERIFVSEDVIGEVLKRHRDGVIGRAFTWGFVQDLNEKTPDTATEAATYLQQVMQKWIITQRIRQEIGEAVMSSLWAGDETIGKNGRGLLRIFIPQSYLDEGGELSSATFEDALDMIHVEYLPAEDAVVLDRKTAMQPGSIYRYENTDGEKRLELTYLDTTVPDKENQPTMMKIMTEDGGTEAEYPFLLGGRLLTYQIERQLMIDDSMRRLQKKVNHAATAEQSNLTTAGWTARLFLNAQMPGDYQRDTVTGEPELDSNGERTFVPEDVEMGPGVASFIPGISYLDNEGNEKITTPTYVRDLPSPPDTFITTKDTTVARMMMQMQQEHVSLVASANASGESRLRARGDFRSSLTPTKEQVDAALVWILETTVALASQISKVTEYVGLRAQAEAVIDTGALTASELKLLMELWQAGFISHQTALSMSGIGDVSAEKLLLAAEMEAANTTATQTADGEATSEPDTTGTTGGISDQPSSSTEDTGG